jgi:hypothetical protein
MARTSHEPKLRRVSLRIRFFETIHGMGTSTFETKLEVMRRTISIVAVLALFCAGRIFSPVAAEGAERPTLFPKLHAGQTFTYLIEYRTQKNVKTESRVVTPSGPQNDQADAQWLLRVEILDVRPDGRRAAIHARSQFESVDSKQTDGKQGTGEGAPTAEGKPVEFTILSDGRADAVTGIDALFPEQRVAWQAWLREFAIAGIFPRDGVKRGQTWKSTEVEESPSPIVRLEWQKSATYVRDEPCAPVQLSELDTAAPKNSASETCAVVLTHAILKQKSSPKDTTPEDFRLHALRTTGTASGTNETITYISLQTGLVVRVKEDAKQFMDVVIAKADGSNQVHYNVDAARHTEILLLADAAPAALSKP